MLGPMLPQQQHAKELPPFQYAVRLTQQNYSAASMPPSDEQQHFHLLSVLEAGEDAKAQPVERIS